MSEKIEKWGENCSKLSHRNSNWNENKTTVNDCWVCSWFWSIVDLRLLKQVSRIIQLMFWKMENDNDLKWGEQMKVVVNQGLNSVLRLCVLAFFLGHFPQIFFSFSMFPTRNFSQQITTSAKMTNSIFPFLKMKSIFPHHTLFWFIFMNFLQTKFK